MVKVTVFVALAGSALLFAAPLLAQAVTGGTGTSNGMGGSINGAGGSANGAGGQPNGAGGQANGAGGMPNGAGGVPNGSGSVLLPPKTTATGGGDPAKQ